MALPRAVRQYDVFLSFRGEDARRGIASFLHKAFCSRGIDKIFKDDKTLEMGDSISEEIKEAIRNSKFAVLVISANYVSSTWCLDELQLIMELHTKKQLIAVPIFYNVDPLDVEQQRGTFALERYEPSRFMQLFSSQKKNMAVKIQKWRKALTQVAGTTGKDLSACVDEATMVSDIVGHISKQLFSMEPLDFSNIVGLDVHMEQLNPLLDIESEEEVRMIGIWGMGGIGKTTIAKCLYDKYSRQFPHYCFIENVRLLAKKGLPYLQEKLLSEIRGKKQESLWSVEKGCSCIKSKLKDKIFLVLDDVDDVDQLHALAKETSWFGPGSRIIITTRDVGLLYSFGVTLLYHVSFLGNDDAIQVFKQVAFKGKQAPSDDIYHQFSIRASRLAQGLPSALEAFGKYLSRFTWKEGWEKALNILETVPQQRIKDILKTSYDDLDKEEQAAFLHVACLFNGDSVHRVNALIEDGDIRVKALEMKSLIDISPDKCITMHVLIEQAAREIVRQESGSMHWRQRILWKTDPIILLLQKDTDTATVEGVALHMCEMLHVLSIDGNVFSAINNLKFFKAFMHLSDVDSKLQFRPGKDKLPKTLRLLQWDAYPMTTLPPEYYPHCLVELNLRHSNLLRLWHGTLELRQLRRLDVTGSKNLTEIPDLSGATLLEELIMKGCTRLEQVPESIGRLSCLQKLDLSECDGLMNLQIDISEKLVFPECEVRGRQQILLKLPRVVKILTSLANLSIEGIIHIELLHLKGDSEHLSFVSAQQIPDELVMEPKNKALIVTSFYDLKSLSIKRFSYIEDGAPFCCISFSGFPCLVELDLINLNIQKIPDDINLLQSLEKLDLSGNGFRNLPSSMKKLPKLIYCRLSNCVKLEALLELPELQTLKLSGCSNLKSLQEPSQAVGEVGPYRLLELELDKCKNVQPEQLSHFTNLIHLDLSRHEFEALPSSIRALSSLGTLCLNNCKKLGSVEDLPESLKHLYAHGCESLENVSLSANHSIKHLDLSHCFSLQQDEQLITHFLNDEYSPEVSQRFLCLPGTRMPEYFHNRSPGTSTEISLQFTFSPTFLGFAACIMVSCERSFSFKFPAFSYHWKCQDDDEIIRIDLKPNLFRSSDIEEEEEEKIPSQHLVIIHVPSSINTQKIQELRLESHLQIPDEFQFSSPGEIHSCGIRIFAQGYTSVDTTLKKKIITM